MKSVTNTLNVVTTAVPCNFKVNYLRLILAMINTAAPRPIRPRIEGSGTDTGVAKALSETVAKERLAAPIFTTLSIKFFIFVLTRY